MHSTIDYSKSSAPQFDAIEDIKQWLGAKWDEINPMMGRLTDIRAFVFYAAFAGISGFPVKAWWEHHHGQGSWDKAWEGEADDLR